MRHNYFLDALAIALVLTEGALAYAGNNEDRNREPLVIEAQGGFAFDGTVITDPAGSGNTFHCDHGYAEYQIPSNARDLPIVMWHSTSTKTWTGDRAAGTPDGFQEIFVRRAFPVYIIDLPRQGRGGDSCLSTSFTPTIGRDQRTFESWRQGVWAPPAPPMFFPNSQAPHTPDYLNQLLRARYPDNEVFPDTDSLEAGSVAKLLERIGPAILFTHSGSGKRGWLTAIQSPNVKGVVSFEPSIEVFPPGEVPGPGTGGAAQLEVPLADFRKLTQFPILIVFGDNIDAPVPRIQASWPAALAHARAFVASVNSHGGNAQLIHLPDIGIFGNSHLMMLELNNIEVADVVSRFLREEQLDKQEGHSAP